MVAPAGLIWGPLAAGPPVAGVAKDAPRDQLNRREKRRAWHRRARRRGLSGRSGTPPPGFAVKRPCSDLPVPLCIPPAFTSWKSDYSSLGPTCMRVAGGVVPWTAGDGCPSKGLLSKQTYAQHTASPWPAPHPVYRRVKPAPGLLTGVVQPTQLLFNELWCGNKMSPTSYGALSFYDPHQPASHGHVYHRRTRRVWSCSTGFTFISNYQEEVTLAAKGDLTSPDSGPHQESPAPGVKEP